MYVRLWAPQLVSKFCHTTPFMCQLQVFYKGLPAELSCRSATGNVKGMRDTTCTCTHLLLILAPESANSNSNNMFDCWVTSICTGMCVKTLKYVWVDQMGACLPQGGVSVLGRHSAALQTLGGP